MRARTKSSLLWGVVGGLSFLVLVQGYVLVVGPLRVSPAVVAVGSLLVGTVATAATYGLAGRLGAKEQT